MEKKFRVWNKKTNDWHKTELPFYGFHIFGECTLVCPPKLEDLEHLEIEQFLFTDYKERDAYENDVVKLHLFGFNGSETEHEFVGILELRELGVWFETGDNNSEGDNMSGYIAAMYGLHEESFEVLGRVKNKLVEL